MRRCGRLTTGLQVEVDPAGVERGAHGREQRRGLRRGEAGRFGLLDLVAELRLQPLAHLLDDVLQQLHLGVDLLGAAEGVLG